MPAIRERTATMEPTSASAFLAIDLGATSGRAVLGTLEDGRMHVRDVHRFPSLLVEEGGHLCWDLERL